MLSTIVENWLAILAFATSVLTGVLGWLLRDRALNKQTLKKGEAEILTAEIGAKVSEANYTQNVQDIYKDLAADLKADREFLKEENLKIREESKAEKEYFRKEIGVLRVQCNSLQDSFNSISLSYAREVEISQNWEKLHSELREKFILLESKYTVMETEYDHLKKAHDKLKIDFDKYKKENK